MKVPVRPGLVVHLDSIRLTEYDDDGFLGVQIDADGTATDGAPELGAQVAPFEALTPYGFNARALDPQVDGAGQVSSGALSLTFWEGARGYSLQLHDPRLMPALARCEPGESVQYGCRNNFIRCHEDGRVSVMCTDDGTEDGKTIDSTVAPDGFSWRGPWGAMRHNEMGFWYRHVSGARMELGGVAGAPAPLDAVRSSFRIDADLATIKSQAVQLGLGTFMPAAKATPTVAADAALLSALQAVQGALSALGAVGINASAGPAIAAAGVAVAAAASTLGTTALAIPATSVQVA